jgi:GNAT superfamily N-acetyltransferase
MEIIRGDWCDILTVIHETYRIWSSGLNKTDYRTYSYVQFSHPWARRNFRAVMLKTGGEIASACKLYEMHYASRGKNFRLLGIGAIYTMERFRGKGYASGLINGIIDLAHEESFDGMILYSDIGPDYYHQFGFEEFNSTDFYIYLPHVRNPNLEAYRDLEIPHHFLIPGDIPQMLRHYKRWQRWQPFAVDRTEEYLSYKLARESYLHCHSTLSWPALEVSFIEDRGEGGYMLTETGGSTLRVLEIVGSEDVRKKFWSALFVRAKKDGMRRIRGWEAGIRDMAPTFDPHPFVPHALYGEGTKIGPMPYAERDWGRGMLLPFNAAIAHWIDIVPSPLLEIDHL